MGGGCEYSFSGSLCFSASVSSFFLVNRGICLSLVVCLIFHWFLK